ncbi:MAG: N-acetylneuraminate synthase family protein [Candidatus Nanopelagicales bacterium]|jgi:N-acetylneuraminate synthase/sialic acid synthase|nr:N-acetylneuraminate synthase family protein [Candidatus Nanopelagicales bacterium]
MREFRIADVLITDASPCVVLAEIGGNHQGQVALAHQLINMAADAGADGVKFQRRHNRTLYTAALLETPYDNPVSFGPTYGAHREALELNLVEYPDLIDHAHRRDLAFVCTAFDEASVADLLMVGVDAIKIASGGVRDQALIRAAVETRLPVLISTGGCEEGDILAAHEWAPDALFLHCTASYPCEWSELNLRYIDRLRRILPDSVIGWSSHDNGIAMAVLAYALGARLVEKHVTLNHTMRGTDHAFSLEPPGLHKLCRDLRRAHVAMGDGIKHYYDSERKPIAKMRRRRTPEGMRITGEVDA